jgi:arylsulfatase A-like enzyme
MQGAENVSRRDLLLKTAAGSLSLAAFTTARTDSAEAQTASKPNIVFILADDLGFADVSCYGRRDFSTPSIDRIAADGMRFMQGYANSAVCTASRVALITGRYQYRLRIGLEEPLTPRSPAKLDLPPEHPSLPSILKKAGYQSTLIG